MGSSQSKGVKTEEQQQWRSKAESPSQEKHNSADSQAPLADHAANFGFPRTPSVDRHTSFRLGLLHTNDSTDNQIQHDLATSPATAAAIRLVNKLSSTVQIDGQEGHLNVSRPPPPPRIRHLSELIDPSELSIDSHVRSPSGNMLAPEQFLVHPDRPRSIRERQEMITEKVRAASRLGLEAENASDEKHSAPSKQAGDGQTKAKRKRGACGCFGGRDED